MVRSRTWWGSQTRPRAQDCNFPVVCEHGYRAACGCNCDQDWITDENAPYRPFPNCNIRMWDPDDSVGYAYLVDHSQYVPKGAPPHSYAVQWITSGHLAYVAWVVGVRGLP